MAQRTPSKRKRYITYYSPIGELPPEVERLLDRQRVVMTAIIEKYGTAKLREVLDLKRMLRGSGLGDEKTLGVFSRHLKVQKRHLKELVEIDALICEQPTHKKVRVEAKCEYCGAYAKDICYDCESVVCGRHIHLVRPFSPVVEDKYGELRDSDVVENWVTCVECAKEVEDLDTHGM